MFAKKETREDYLRLFSEPPRNYADILQDIPPPLPSYAPELLAARWVTRDLRCEHWPARAADMLEAGYDTPSLRILAGALQVTSSADAEPLVLRMFRELKVPYPITEKQATHLFARELAREALSGVTNIWRAARDIAFLARLNDWEDAAINSIDSCIDAIDIEPEWRPST